jgi:hypothetical protein
LVKIVIIKEEVEHLIYAGHEPLLTLILPDRPWITFLQLLKIEHQFTPHLRKGEVRLGRLIS